MSSGRTRRSDEGGRRGERSDRGDRGDRPPRREERRGGRNRFEQKSVYIVANTKFLYLTRDLKY